MMAFIIKLSFTLAGEFVLLSFDSVALHLRSMSRRFNFRRKSFTHVPLLQSIV